VWRECGEVWECVSVVWRVVGSCCVWSVGVEREVEYECGVWGVPLSTCVVAVSSLFSSILLSLVTLGSTESSKSLLCASIFVPHTRVFSCVKLGDAHGDGG
jgi:hypothetical protein